MENLRVGIIGLGIGEKHITGYQSHPQCKVVALCDFDREKFVTAKEKYSGMKVVEKAEEILADPEIDIVSIASYDNYHYDHILQAITHNKHFFVEKPFCLYQQEAVKIRALMNEKPTLRMSSNLVLRVTPRFKILREMISDGEMGQLFCIEGDYNYGRLHKITQGWRGKLDFYSVVYGGGIHLVDLLLWLTGDFVEEVAAFGNNIASKGTDFRYNDLVLSILKFKSGMVGKISANFGCVFPHFHRLSVYGTKATFLNGLEYGMFYKSREPAQGGEKINAAYPGTLQGQIIFSFIDSILNGTSAIVSEEDVFRAMSVCFAIEKAAKESCSVKVTYI